MEHTEIIKKAEQLCRQYEDKVTVYLIEKSHNKPLNTDINRIGGSPIGISDDSWPHFEGKPMVHLITIDLTSVPVLKKKFADHVRAITLFVSDLVENEAYYPENDETKVIHLKEADIKKVPHRVSVNDPKNVMPAFTFQCHEIEVPKIIFTEDIYSILDEDESNPICELYNVLFGSAIVGGEALWLQEPEYNGEFVLQFDESFINMNLGDAGSMYVFKDVAFWQCC